MFKGNLVHYTVIVYLILIIFTISTQVQGSLSSSSSSLTKSSSSSTTTTKNLEKRENFHWPGASTGTGSGSWWWSHLWDRFNDEDFSPPPPPPSSNEQQQQQQRTWWTWSSKEGYKSGHGTPPSNPSNPTNSNLNVNFNTNVNTDTDSDSDTNSQNDDYNSNPHHQTGSINRTQVNQWLEEHNKIRARYGADPLTWSEELVRASKRLTDKCIWKHTSNNPFGENMSAGQINIQQVVQGWVKGPSEKNTFSGKSNSEPSHFTQVVWLSTTELGCYQTTCQRVKGSHLPQSPVTFWACNYNPPGNVIGEFKQNVKALPGGNPI